MPEGELAVISIAQYKKSFSSSAPEINFVQQHIMLHRRIALKDTPTPQPNEVAGDRFWFHHSGVDFDTSGRYRFVDRARLHGYLTERLS